MRILLQNKFLYIRFHTLPTANDTANVTERKVILVHPTHSYSFRTCDIFHPQVGSLVAMLNGTDRHRRTACHDLAEHRADLTGLADRRAGHRPCYAELRLRQLLQISTCRCCRGHLNRRRSENVRHAEGRLPSPAGPSSFACDECDPQSGFKPSPCARFDSCAVSSCSMRLCQDWSLAAVHVRGWRPAS